MPVWPPEVRYLDQVRAHALQQAVRLVATGQPLSMAERAEAAGTALAIAGEFEAYLLAGQAGVE